MSSVFGARLIAGCIAVVLLTTRAVLAAAPPMASCSPIPSGFSELPNLGGDADTSVNLQVGYDADTQRLCYVATGLPATPVIRVGVGHSLSITVANTLRDTGSTETLNCPIDSFEGEGNYCLAKPQFSAAPGPDGSYYPLMANQAVSADGTTNLHVHGLMVSPRGCSDDTMSSVIFPTNWGGPLDGLLPCQTTPTSLTYSYKLPPYQPAGLYWYHDHRHGSAEQEVQMGLAGPIVVEDAGDAARAEIGVTDEILLITDTPLRACTDGVSCDVAPARLRHHAVRPVTPNVSSATASPGTLDPRIDQLDQAGCALGASGAAGGFELWTLKLNGAQIAENNPGFPSDAEVLQKTMQPGQRQIFRLANASADSFVAPQLMLVANGVQSVEPLEVFARDGVGLADAQGRRHLTDFNVTQDPLIVPPAGRLEFVVHAPPPGATLYLDSAAVLPGCGGNAYPSRRLLMITSSGTPVSPGASDDSDLLAKTPSLAKFFATQGATASVHRTFVLSEYPRGFTYGLTRWTSGTPTTADYDQNQLDFYITEVAADDGSVNPKSIALRPFMTGMTGMADMMRPQVVVHLHGQQSVTEQWLIQNSTLEVHCLSHPPSAFP